MNNWRGLTVMILFCLLLPLVLGQTYKQVQKIDIPVCYGNITFKIDATQSYSPNDIKMDGCSTPYYCDCNGEQKTINFLVLDNVSNVFTITGEYYIQPMIVYTSTPDQMYNPNEDNKRTIKLSDIKVGAEVKSNDDNKENLVSVDMTKILLIIMGVLVIIGGGIFVIIKVLIGGKEKTARPKQVQQPLKTKTNNDDVREYLKQLEDERRQK